ncbi:TIGR01459 family HAD-type hydrolase [Fibrivirga algicola]|uniref:TIGR01459 family HAD-type hydrolase n=1 Tax=Fibrivirga algicola TaxID=2950420 RepID=A0ABX0QD21_9BACT|nr:TIGR01459 family HAD-type hydrolase [Fibrivirga algicola]ARK09425.1 haloacid dehalogenase [Fibrella sp. ES10-3-2-2]NID10299.1 TIGR01459 family HAD-type hydrolase [Fibrivirga algicola]
MTSFASLIDQYKAVFFDAYGVLKNAHGLIPGVDRTINALIQTEKPFYVLTNDASRSPDQLAESYARLGLPMVTADRIVSSGMLAREYLQLKVSHGTVAYLGTDTSAHYIENADLHALPIREVDLNNAGDITALVLLDDEGFDWNTDLNKTVNLLRQRNIPVIVANTDATYPVSGNRVAVAIGAVADMLERIVGKQFIRFGKPDAQLFMFAYDLLRDSPSERAPIGKNEILMVGDTLKSDILGGNKFGFDTALVLTGNTPAEDVDLRIKATGIIPTYVCESAAV